MSEKKHYHRGRRRTGRKKSGGKGRIVSNIILILAVLVFCVSAFQLFRILSGYHEGRKEYDEVKALAVTEEGEGDGEKARFSVDFDTLKGINPDTVGWIRFDPEPAQISYPLVQTTDNSTYLNKTFSASENTVGAIFVNTYNNPDFNDRNTIIYGHRMNDNSMFHDLAKYEERSFWESNPYFYIYTPDGKVRTYTVFSAGVVKDTADNYKIDYASDAEYEEYLKLCQDSSNYQVDVELNAQSQIISLSTCTNVRDDERFLVQGVLTATD